MIDIKLLREDPELVKESQRHRFAPVQIVDEVLKLDKEWHHAQFCVDKKQIDLKKIEKQISKANEDAWELKKINELNDEISLMKIEANSLKTRRDRKLHEIGNVVHHSVPVSTNNDVIVREWGTPRQKTGLKNHVELVQLLDIADIDKGALVAGERGYFLRGKGVLLNMALILYGLQFLEKRGYFPLMTPSCMLESMMGKCVQFSQFKELYKVTGGKDEEDKYLIPTSEQALCAYHAGNTLDDISLPIRYAGYSSCFRKEAEKNGKDSVGIYRVHEFQKVEQFCITSPLEEDSLNMLEEMLKNAQDFYEELGLPYKVVSIVSGALQDEAAKKYDLDAWFPASGRYRQLVSCSNCTDYQSRNLQIKYKHPNAGKYVHLLNSTLTATERTMCCIVENYQTESGVRIPEVLQPFVGTDFLPFKNKGGEKGNGVE